MSSTSLQHVLDFFNLGALSLGKMLGAATAAGVFPLAAYLVSSYRDWLALPRGGLPANPAGYMINLVLQAIARRDVRAPAPYTLEDTEALYGAVALRSFFTPAGLPPPQRVGKRPAVPSYVAPQRQTSDYATAGMRTRMEAFLTAIVAANPDLLETRPSRLEGPTHDAIWLGRDVTIPKFLKGTRGELAHVHGEGSTHLVLSLADATRAIELFWAERHPLSGGPGGVIPWNYVLLYAPRSEDEFHTWKTFVAASMRFNATAAAGREVTVPSPSSQ
ncbi:hypothetical protein F4780DRAFT_721980 [Xylariomycetidae sp. FL0641]|nr:hypothetical protein F4780DRAFT_721980 [Xylariomycetidae sp. FL0641]